MACRLASVSALCVLSLVTMSPANAQTQIRNFNLNCGLIGKFVRYPPHLQHCKALAHCSDARTCPRKRGVRKIPELALTVPDELEDETGTSPPDTSVPGDINDPDTGQPGSPSQPGNQDSLGARAGAQVSARAGGTNLGAEGGASIGSGSDGSASASVGGNAVAGGALGGVGVGAQGSLGVGGL
jgi:hypothetical protein